MHLPDAAYCCSRGHLPAHLATWLRLSSSKLIDGAAAGAGAGVVQQASPAVQAVFLCACLAPGPRSAKGTQQHCSRQGEGQGY